MRSSVKTAVALTAATILTASPALSPAARAQAAPGPSDQSGQPPAQPGQQSQSQSKPGAAAAKLSEQDRDFIHKVAKGGMMQVELSKVAATQSRHPKVREFAVNTIANLGKAGGMLHAMAKQAGMELPEQPPEDVQKLTDALAKTEGDTLNREYVALILPASTVAVNVFEDEAENGRNPEFVNFAKQMLPKIKKHEQMAQNLSQNMGGAVANKTMAPPPSGSSAPPPARELPQTSPPASPQDNPPASPHK